MTIDILLDVAKTFGVAAVVAMICIYALYKITDWLKTQYEDNDKERKETIDKLITQIVSTNSELVSVVKNNSSSIDNCTRTLELNSKIMSDLSLKLTLSLKKD